MSRKIKAQSEEEKLIFGYTEMGAINLELANESIEADNEAQVCIEKKLTECE